MRVPTAVIAAAVIVVASASVAGEQPPVSNADCNQPAPTALTTVPLPGHPFSIVSTQDGCWLFVSLTSVDPKSNGVAVLRRALGTIAMTRMFAIEGREGRPPLRPGPSGMVITHDGQLLIAANDDDVVFLDVKSMISGEADPTVGHMSDGRSAGSIYVNVTRGDRFLFVSDEHSETISVINLEKARHSNFDRSAMVGKIPVGVASIALTFSPDEKWLYTTREVASAS